MRRFYEGLSNGQFVEMLIDPSLLTSASPQNNAILQQDRQFVVDTILRTESGYVDANCNQIMFYNQGTSVVTINGVTLAANVGWSIPGNYGEKDVTKYNAIFSGGGVNSLLVVRKNYTS